MIQAHLGKPPLSILDCSCGIGTQAIGLALLGYVVHATDLSPKAVERAQEEAKRLKADLTFGVADFRVLETQVEGIFDAVISCDNSLPHLLRDEDLLLAARNIRSKLREGGLFLASIRDYDHILRERPRSTLPKIFGGDEERRIVFQVWDWEEGENIYTVHHFIVRELGGEWQTVHQATAYKAWLREEFDRILDEVGFHKLCWHMPDETGYYQPIVTAFKE
jgi:SAM-dependent methyltransferase